MKPRMKFKRRRQGITDYRKRLALVLSGKPRLVIRKGNGNVVVQVVKFDPAGDRVAVTVDLRHIRKAGWKGGANLPAAYLIGYLAGKSAVKAGIKEAVLDIGRHPATRGGKVFAALKGAVDAGLDVPHDESVLPSEERIRGEHIAGYSGAKEPQFAGYRKAKLDPAKLPAHFEEVLKKVKGG